MKIILGLIFLSGLNSFASTIPKIKVRIAQAREKLNVSGRDIDRMLWPRNEQRFFKGKKEFLFNCKSRLYNQSKSFKPQKLASMTSKTGMLKWDGESYKGALHVQTSKLKNGCDIINETSLEDYLASLLAKEMRFDWPIEALKAQAVAARSYAYFKIKSQQVSKSHGHKVHYDLENSEKHQVNGNFFDATRSTHKAAKGTQGEILFNKKGENVPVFFHSKCGGKTFTPGQVWSRNIAGYEGVTCPFCHKHGLRDWKGSMSTKELTHSLKKALFKYKGVSNKSNKLRFIKDKESDSHLKFYLGDQFHVLKKSRLRGTLGRKKLPSNYFSLKVNKKKQVSFSGSGFGHGVGMCQFGAKELALKGYNYKQILEHYFPALILKKIY